MPFGLCNAPGTFQHFVNDKFRDYLDEFLVIYLDDLLIYSDTLEEHKRHVRLVLKRLQEAGLYVKPQKCQFHATKVSFLGFMISSDGIHMDPAKVEAVLEWERPKSAHDIQVFLGFANFYRRFIKGYSKITAPLTNLTRKEVKFKWSPEAEDAFSSLKQAFCTAPILSHFDFTKPAIIEVDASDFAYGGVLSQYDEDDVLHPCAFISKKFNAAELNYEIYDKEMLARLLNACTAIGDTTSRAPDNKFKYSQITKICSGSRKQRPTIVAKHAGRKSFLDSTSRLRFAREFIKGNQTHYLDGLITVHLKGEIQSGINMSSRFSSLTKSKISKVTHIPFQQWR